MQIVGEAENLLEWAEKTECDVGEERQAFQEILQRRKRSVMR